MKTAVFILAGLVLSTTVCFATNLFQIKKSDSNIKLLIFPLSMAIIENRPSKSFYFPIDINAPLVSEEWGLNLSDNKQIIKTLGATDPARITPSRIGESVYGELGRENLAKLSKTNPERILFIFRREINLSGERKFDSEKMKPGALFSKGPPYHLKIRTRGLLYLTKQKRILFLQPNEKEIAFKDDNTKTKINALNREGLKNLAKEAKKILNKNKFEKRQSSY